MVPKGNEFLPNLELSQIMGLYKQEQNAKAKIRLQELASGILTDYGINISKQENFLK